MKVDPLCGPSRSDSMELAKAVLSEKDEIPGLFMYYKKVVETLYDF